MTVNTIEIDGHKAVINYDPEIEMFRGEFVNLNGGADFYAADVVQLKKEAEISLRVFLETCEERGIEPMKNYSGKFNVRIKPEVHRNLVVLAQAENVSLNALIAETVETMVQAAESASITLKDVREHFQALIVEQKAPQPKKKPVTKVNRL